MPTPYTTRSGLKIGLAYIPRQHRTMDMDEYRLQQALLTRGGIKKRRPTAVLLVLVVVAVMIWM